MATNPHKARLTVDMNSEEHSYLKMACAKLGVTMRQFMLLATFEKMEQLEDVWLAKRARETLKRIESGEENTSSWKKARERLM
jgi:predicted DNA-binding protein